MSKKQQAVGEKYNAPFCSTLRGLMDSRGINQETLAKEVGKSRQTVSQYVNGISVPSYEALVKIADFFNVSTDFLLGRTQAPDIKPAAVDDLGLPPEVIAEIMNYKEAADTGVPHSLKGYILFMKIFGNSALFSLIHGLNEDLQFVSNGGELNLDMKQEFNNFSPSIKEFFIESALADELRAIHPELDGRFIVVCGTDLLQYKMRKICDIFRMRLEEKLRYRAVLGDRLP